MRMTVKSEYGVLALIDLACHYGEGPVSAREVASRQHIPGKFLEQLFVSLRKAGLVSARRGPHGGFVLDRAPRDITVLDVVEALEGPLRPTVCRAEEAGGCDRSGHCAAGNVWERATSAVRAVLEKTTLADLAATQTRMDEQPGS